MQETARKRPLLLQESSCGGAAGPLVPQNPTCSGCHWRLSHLSAWGGFKTRVRLAKAVLPTGFIFLPTEGGGSCDRRKSVHSRASSPWTAPQVPGSSLSQRRGKYYHLVSGTRLERRGGKHLLKVTQLTRDSNALHLQITKTTQYSAHGRHPFTR